MLDDATSPRWAMQEAVLILAHEGTTAAVASLEAYMPVAHTKLAGFAECAQDEGRYFANVPRNPEEEHRMMQQEVRQAWEDRSIAAQSKNLGRDRTRIGAAQVRDGDRPTAVAQGAD